MPALSRQVALLFLIACTKQQPPPPPAATVASASVSVVVVASSAPAPVVVVVEASVPELIVPVGMTIQAGFPAPGGVGGAEYAYGKLYEFLGFAFAAGVLGSLVKRVIEWGLGLASYLVYLGMKQQLRDPEAGVRAQAAVVSSPSSAVSSQ